MLALSRLVALACSLSFLLQPARAEPSAEQVSLLTTYLFDQAVAAAPCMLKCADACAF